MEEKKNKTFGELAKESWESGCATGRNFARDRSELRKEIANRVRRCRLDARLTQEEVSKNIDVNPLTYKGYENCRSDIPTVYLVRIADYYGTSVDYLVGRTDNKDGAIPAKGESTEADTNARISQLEKLVAQLLGNQDSQ